MTSTPSDTLEPHVIGQATLTFPGAQLWWVDEGDVRGLNTPGTSLAARWHRLNDAGRIAIDGLAARARDRRVGVSGIVAFTEADSAEHLAVVAMPLVDPDARSLGVLLQVRDATLDITMRNALIDSRQRYRDMVTISSDIAWETDAEMRFTFVSADGIAGWDATGLIGRVATEILFDPKGDPGQFATEVPEAGTDMWMRDPEGRAVCYETAVLPLHDRAGTRVARGIGRDVTEARHRDLALAQAHARERLVRFVVDEIRGGVDPGEVLARSAEVLARTMGASSVAVYRLIDNLPGAAVAAVGMAPSSDALTALARTTRGVAEPIGLDADDGRWMAVAVHFAAAPVGLLLAGRAANATPWEPDMYELLRAIEPHMGVALRQAAERERLEQQSRTDPLTGLLNRRAFKVELAAALDRSARRGRSGALLYIDLDNFKPVNDLLGHHAGDIALVEIARLMIRRTRAYDLVARLGGDEFAIWLDETDLGVASRRASEMVRDMVDLQPAGADASRPLGMSIGLAMFDPANRSPDVETSDAVVARADRAMYQAKASGKGQVSIAPPAGAGP